MQNLGTSSYPVSLSACRVNILTWSELNDDHAETGSQVDSVRREETKDEGLVFTHNAAAASRPLHLLNTHKQTVVSRENKT